MSEREQLGANGQPVPFVLQGSFRKHLDEIQSAMETLNSTELARAIAPHDCTAIDEQDGFVLLPGQEDTDPRQVEAEYLQKVLSLEALGGFSLWVTPDGYIGKSAAYEYGIAQACGVPAFFTEAPADVPFYVPQASIRSAEQLSQDLRRNGGKLPPDARSNEPVGALWERLPFPTAAVAVGGIVTYRNKLLLAEDGRWQGKKLTVPGTTVRSREARDEALDRALTDKFGVSVSAVAPFRTSFMLENSGYGKPVSSLVFDDRRITAASETVRPQGEVSLYWTTVDEVEGLLGSGEIEPNAAELLREHLAEAA